LVEIIEAQQPETVAAAGVQPTQQSRAEIAQMERAAGRGGKATGNPLLAQAEPHCEAFIQGIGKHEWACKPKKAALSGRSTAALSAVRLSLEPGL
jgi:hypothetical protein